MAQGSKKSKATGSPPSAPSRNCPLDCWHPPLRRCPLDLTHLLAMLWRALSFPLPLGCLSLALTAWCSLGLPGSFLLPSVDEASQGVWRRFIYSTEDTGSQRSFHCGCHLHLLPGYCPPSQTWGSEPAYQYKNCQLLVWTCFILPPTSSSLSSSIGSLSIRFSGPPLQLPACISLLGLS